MVQNSSVYTGIMYGTEANAYTSQDPVYNSVWYPLCVCPSFPDVYVGKEEG